MKKTIQVAALCGMAAFALLLGGCADPAPVTALASAMPATGRMMAPITAATGRITATTFLSAAAMVIRATTAVTTSTEGFTAAAGPGISAAVVVAISRLRREAAVSAEAVMPAVAASAGAAMAAAAVAGTDNEPVIGRLTGIIPAEPHRPVLWRGAGRWRLARFGAIATIKSIIWTIA